MNDDVSDVEISTKEAEEIQREFNNLDDLLIWIRRFLSIGGIWPLKNTRIHAAIVIFYMVVQLISEYGGLIDVAGNLQSVVLSVLECAMQTMVLSKLIVFRYSNMLCKLIIAMREDFREENYTNLVEKKIYLKYNFFSKLYFKVSVPYILSAATLYYLRPLLTSFITGTFGTNGSYIPPFQTRIYFSIEDTTTYLTVYLWYFPMVYLLAVHNAFICVLVTIILHICGQLAIVEHRIKHLNYDPVTDNSQVIFKSLVERHQRSIWMAKAFDDSFHFVLLIDLTGTTALIGLMSYVLITGPGSDNTFFYIYTVCITATLFVLFGYCYVGECLLTNSIRIHQVYYECNWYKASTKFRKALSICLVNSNEPLTMTAGKFFVFSFSGYADVLKSAGSYLSMLRKVSMTED